MKEQTILNIWMVVVVVAVASGMLYFKGLMA